MKTEQEIMKRLKEYKSRKSFKEDPFDLSVDPAVTMTRMTVHSFVAVLEWVLELPLDPPIDGYKSN